MANVLPLNGYGSDSFNQLGGIPTQPDTLARFNNRGAMMAPPLQKYMAQPNSNQQPSVPILDNTTQQLHPLARNVRNVDPVIDTKGVPVSDTKDSEHIDSEALKNLSDQELLEKGNKQLEEAKKAYTTYGQNSLAHNARKALEPFIVCANNAKAHFPIAGVDWFKSSEKLIESLKKLELPQGTPDDLAVTIQFPGEEVISLIPPGNGLKTKNPTQVYECYLHAFGVMDKKVTEFNNGNDNALAQAEAKFNDVFATLKAIREEIDKRKLKPSESQLEYDFQKFRDNGITISAVADGREFAFYENKFLHKAAEVP